MLKEKRKIERGMQLLVMGLFVFNLVKRSEITNLDAIGYERDLVIPEFIRNGAQL